MMSQSLPEFAYQWIEQWKRAAPRLQAIRDEELRRRGGAPPGKVHSADESITLFDRYPERNGMVVMQQWLLRRHLLELAKQNTDVNCSE